MSLLNDFNQPGVSFTQQIIDMSRRRRQTALPVFIGYSLLEAHQLISVRSFQHFQEMVKDSPADLPSGSGFEYCLRHYFDNDGTECFVISLGNVVQGDNDFLNDVIYELIDSEPAITLLAMPDMVMLSADQYLLLIEKLAVFCASNINLFAIVDLPAAPKDAQAFIDAHDVHGAERLAGYWPWLKTDYIESNGQRSNQYHCIPPSGAVVAAIQVSDRERGIWKAPANIPLKRVIQPEYSHLTPVSLFHADPVNGRSANQIRSFPARGVLLWGSRTLKASTERQKLYIQNRRLVMWIESELHYLLQPFVFEPNNEITWYRIKALIRRTLRELWERGGLLGGSEDDAYRILVGIGESMSEDDLADGLLRIRIAVAIHQPAEFIQISLNFYVNSVESGEVDRMNLL
ncbi:TPA: phage tail sheath family protein [Serratia odorifera]|nr:phage tail sheath family protein [Serratia odorifera]